MAYSGAGVNTKMPKTSLAHARPSLTQGRPQARIPAASAVPVAQSLVSGRSRLQRKCGSADLLSGCRGISGTERRVRSERRVRPQANRGGAANRICSASAHAPAKCEWPTSYPRTRPPPPPSTNPRWSGSRACEVNARVAFVSRILANFHLLCLHCSPNLWSDVSSDWSRHGHGTKSKID